MERRLSTIVLLANIAFSALLFLLCLLEVTGAMEMFRWRGSWWGFAVAGLAYLGFNALFLRQQFESRLTRTLKLKEGDMMFEVAEAAIEDSLARVVRQLPDVHSARVNLRTSDGGPVRIDVGTDTYEEVRVPELVTKVRETVQRRFADLAGRERQPEVHVRVLHIEPIEARKTKREEKPGGNGPAPAVDLSKGPVYPITD